MKNIFYFLGLVVLVVALFNFKEPNQKTYVAHRSTQATYIG